MTARLLVIEDNPINRELLDYLLRAYGFEVLKAVDGHVGLDIARREQPDLILCDIQMPGMDGFEFALRAKADDRLRQVPLVAVTAFAMVGDRDRILSTGFDAYIAKPIDPQELLDTIRTLLPAPSHAPAATPHPPSSHAVAVSAAAQTILALDDTAFNLELKRGLLEPHGYEVLTASTAAQALTLARERLPALIISDVGMAEGSGFDFIRAVKADARLRGIPFLFLSSTHWDEASRLLGLQLGAINYLRRPMDPELLLAEIQACLGG